MANEKNTAVKGYKINFANNTITVNYTFKKASEEYGTAEYELLKNILADFPTMTIRTVDHYILQKSLQKLQFPKRAPPVNSGLLLFCLL